MKPGLMRVALEETTVYTYTVDVPKKTLESPAVTGMGTVSRATLGDQVYERVRDAIIRGEIAAGTEINQVELAGMLGVSRVPVREALRRLQAERLIEANPFQRYVVTQLSPEQVLELFDLRQQLEVFAAIRSRSRADYADGLREARTVAASMEVGMSAEDWLQADMAFHRVLYGRGSAVSSIIDEVRFRIYRYVHLASPDIDRRAEVLAEHQAILDAFERGDENEIRSLVEIHVGHTRDRLVKVIGLDQA